MNAAIKLPVCVFEIETGDIELYYDINELRLVVEEFWDILGEDFKFWDSDGFPLSFEESFWRKSDNGSIQHNKNEGELLKIHLRNYAKKKGISVDNSNDMNLSDLIDCLTNRK